MITKKRLQSYAKLIVKTGVNVRRGQLVIVRAELDQPEFVKMVVDESYKAGARRVLVDWVYSPLEKSDYLYADVDELGTVQEFEKERWEYQARELPCKIYLLSEDPDGLVGVDPAKMAEVGKRRSAVIKPIRNKMENKYQWCIAGVPGVKWAKKLFPNDSEKVAVRKLWEAILGTSRVVGNPRTAWKEHNRELAERSGHLNDLKLKTLRYKSKNGTDFTVGLNPDVLFAAGGEKTTSGIYFNPNIPTEEVFTSPMRGEAEGTVVATKPLCYNGTLIENFSITFKDGRAVDCHAEKNENLLRELIGMDEGASYLGEIALVPYSSPIQKTGLLFYNTLYDENAVCHLALGMGFTNLHRDYEKIGEDGAHKAGINDSIIHEDFMIGSEDLSIVGTTVGGKEVVIFKDGEFAF